MLDATARDCVLCAGDRILAHSLVRTQHLAPGHPHPPPPDKDPGVGTLSRNAGEGRADVGTRAPLPYYGRGRTQPPQGWVGEGNAARFQPPARGHVEDYGAPGAP